MGSNNTQNNEDQTQVEWYDHVYAAGIANNSWSLDEVDPAVEYAVKRLSDNQRRALDVGCALGRNLKYLVDPKLVDGKPFAVTAVEQSSVAIEHIKQYRVQHQLDITTHLGDIRNMSFIRCYDLVILSYVLDQLLREDAIKMIRHMQEITTSGGLHAITTFVTDDRNHQVTWAFNSSEICEMYSAWNIILPIVVPLSDIYKMPPYATGVLHMLVEKP